MAYKLNSRCGCCGGCVGAEMAFWVSNENGAKDDLFEISFAAFAGPYILDVSTGLPITLELGDNYAGPVDGHLIVPPSFSGFTFSDFTFSYPGGPSAAQAAWVTGADPHRRLLTCPNLPTVYPATTYNIYMKNVQNNGNGNLGAISLYQICLDPGTSKPVLEFVIGSGVYTGSSGTDLNVNFTSGPCHTCP